MQFGLAIAKILPELIATSKGCPRVAAEDVVGLQAFVHGRSETAELELEQLYRDAKLSSPYEYIRGCTKLRMPSEWKQHAPHQWPEPEIPSDSEEAG